MNLTKSLQRLKSDLTNKETTLKAIQNHYPYLANLSEKQILAYFEVATIDELSTDIGTTQPYSKDQDHHNEQNISLCSCTDTQGKTKDLYESEESALKKATVFVGQKKIQLKVYVCPNGCGWHLTKG